MLKVDGIIIFPDPDVVAKHGDTLARVEEDERKRIMIHTGFGEFKVEMRRLEKRIAKALAKHKKAQKWQ